MEFAEVNGAGLRYELSGKGSRTLVLVHEMGGSLESWDDVAPSFAPSRQVLRYDFRGSGLSQKVRVALSIETSTRNAMGLNEYLVIHGTARITEGGAAELLQKLAHT